MNNRLSDETLVILGNTPDWTDSETKMHKEVCYPPLERIVDRLIRRPEVEAVTGMSCSEIYRRMDRGEFPRPNTYRGHTGVARLHGGYPR